MKKPVVLSSILILFVVLSGCGAAAAVDYGYHTNFKSTQAVKQTGGNYAKNKWLPRHEQKRIDIKKQKVDLLFLGDSITHSWERKPAKETWNKYFAHLNPFNIGFRGDKTENVLWRLQNGAVEGADPKLVVLLIGTNNARARWEKSEETAYGIKAIVNELQIRLPNSKILIMAIFPRSEKPDNRLRKLNDGTNKIIKTYADNKKIFYLDINDKFLDKKGILSKDVMPDRLHPNKKGYEIWGKAMAPTVMKLLGQ